MPVPLSISAWARSIASHWAIAFRDLCVVGYWHIVTFFMLLVTGYIYVWRKGVLDWGHER